MKAHSDMAAFLHLIPPYSASNQIQNWNFLFIRDLINITLSIASFHYAIGGFQRFTTWLLYSSTPCSLKGMPSKVREHKASKGGKDFFLASRDSGVSFRAKFPVSLSNHIGFTPWLLHSSTHHSPVGFLYLKTGRAQDTWHYYDYYLTMG